MPFAQPRLPAPAPLFVGIEPGTGILQFKVGPKGKSHTSSIFEFIMFASGRCGRY